MKNTFYLLFTIYYLLLLPNSAFSSDTEGSPGRNQSSIVNSQLSIGSIEVAGNRSIAGSEILSRVRSRPGEIFDTETAAEDARRIADLAGVEYSYYNTAVVENEIQLTFIVVERNLVRSIVFVGNSKVKSSKLRKKLDLKVGDYLDPITADAATKTLIEFYRKKGFAFANVLLDDEKLRRGQLAYTINEGPRVKINSVKFSGNNTLKTKELKKTVKTKSAKLLLLPAYYVQEYVDKDLTRLQNIYYERGFLNIGATAKRQFNKDKSKVRLTFVIDEGTAYNVEKITFVGNEHFEEKQLRKESKLQQGQTYNQRKADADIRRILKLYRENGFIDAKVEKSVRFISKDRVNVDFGITEGGRFRIGRINITGNEQTQDKVIRRVLDEYDFKPGLWYNADIARGDGSGELERNIRRMVLTESATITPSGEPRPSEGLGEAPGQKDAQVSIIEGQTGMVMLGAGVSSDAGAIGQLVFEQKNFDIRDKPKSFYDFITGRAFKGAGQSLRIALEPGTERSRYSISFTEPYLMNKPISLDVIGESFEWERECYDENRMRGYVGFEKRYRNRWRRSVGFRVENVDVGSVDPGAPKEIKDVEGDNFLAGIKLGVSRDLTDDRFNPSRGYHFRAGYEQVGGDHTFGILSGTYSRYRTLYEDLAERKTILATKLHVATVVGDAPPFEKFYAGGSRSIRGFDYRGVSTRAGTDKDPIGSDWIFLANAEVTVPLVSDNLSALFFIDTGMIDTGGARASIGTGIQIMIPQWFGPVPMRFEIATPLMKDGDDDIQVFSFSVGRLF